MFCILPTSVALKLAICRTGSKCKAQLSRRPINQEKSVVLTADFPVGQSEVGPCCQEDQYGKNLMYSVGASPVDTKQMVQRLRQEVEGGTSSIEKIGFWKSRVGRFASV